MSEAAKLTDERLTRMLEYPLSELTAVDIKSMARELLRLRSSLPPDAAGEQAADEWKSKLLLPFLDEMSKHANWCRKMGSDVANCTCPAEAAAYEAAQIREHIAALSPASTRGQP